MTSRLPLGTITDSAANARVSFPALPHRGTDGTPDHADPAWAPNVTATPALFIALAGEASPFKDGDSGHRPAQAALVGSDVRRADALAGGSQESPSPLIHTEDDDMRLEHVRTTIAGAFLALAFSACGSSDPTTAASQTSQSAKAPKVDARASEFTGSGPYRQPEDPCTTNSPGCDDGEWPTADTEAASTPAPAQDEPLSPDTDAKIAARAAQVAIETYRIDHQTYAGADVPALISIESSLADGAAGSFKVTSTSQNGYALSVASGSGTTFRIERSASGAVRRDCSAPQTGECPADGAW